MRSKLEAHLTKLGAANAFWWLLGAPICLVTETLALG
jgi:hypothetical protein